MNEQQTEGDSEEGTTSDDYVSIEDATNEELAAFIAEDSGEEVDEDGTYISQEGAQTESVASPEQEGTEDEAEDNTQPSYEQLQQQIAESQNLIQQMKERFEQQEHFLKRRNNDVGQARQEASRLREENEKLQEILEDKLLSNPVEGLKIRDRIQENEQRIDQAEQDADFQEYVEHSQQILSRHLQQDDYDMDAWSEVLAADGIPQERIAQMKQNPLSVLRPDTMIQVAKRARERKVLRNVYGALLKLKEENEKLKSRSGQVLDKVQRSLQEKPRMNGSPGSSAVVENRTPVKFEDMSSEELAEFISRNG